MVMMKTKSDQSTGLFSWFGGGTFLATLEEIPTEYLMTWIGHAGILIEPLHLVDELID